MTKTKEEEAAEAARLDAEKLAADKAAADKLVIDSAAEVRKKEEKSVENLTETKPGGRFKVGDDFVNANGESVK